MEMKKYLHFVEMKKIFALCGNEQKIFALCGHENKYLHFVEMKKKLYFVEMKTNILHYVEIAEMKKYLQFVEMRALYLWKRLVHYRRPFREEKELP